MLSCLVAALFFYDNSSSRTPTLKGVLVQKRDQHISFYLEKV